uniref:SFRICE_011037 n=1 Tax=Spodoptera frugiperda TaxID=7108 RepID=A0A2H1VJS4_SPOFR
MGIGKIGKGEIAHLILVGLCGTENEDACFTCARLSLRNRPMASANPQKSGDRSQFPEANDPVDSFDGIDEVKEEIIAVFQVNKIDARVLNDIEKVD